MKIENYKLINKGYLLASFDVVIPEWALTVRNCTLFKKDNKKWIGFPCKSYKEKDGSIKHFSYLLMEKEAKERFDQKCLKLLPEYEQNLATHEELPF